MEKFNAHMGKYGILYAILALAIGMFVGYMWDKWFPSTDRAIQDRRDVCICPDGSRHPSALAGTRKCETACSGGVI